MRCRVLSPTCTRHPVMVSLLDIEARLAGFGNCLWTRLARDSSMRRVPAGAFSSDAAAQDVPAERSSAHRLPDGRYRDGNHHCFGWSTGFG